MSNPESNDDGLAFAMLIVTRCRAEGREAKAAGQPASACPYSDELERAGWLDGWSKA
jgi:ribosome modulation factor